MGQPERPLEQSGLSTLFATSLIQIAGSFAIAGPFAISILIVHVEHLPESWMGYYTSLIYAAAIVGSMVTTRLLASFSIRFVQFAALLATGLGFQLFSQVGTAPLPLVTAIAGITLMGLAYGVIVPSSSLALAECYSRRMQPLVVSVRQTGVPTGTAMVALVAPVVAYHYGWHYMVAVVWALVAITGLLAMRGLKDFGTRANAPFVRQHVLSALRASLAEPATRRLALVSGAYGINQAALTTYLVPSLVWLHGMSVGRSASYLALATLAGAVARIVFGITTARFGRAGLHLGLLGVLSGFAWLLLLWPLPTFPRIAAGSVLLGISAMGWNGILLAEIALVAPNGKTAEAVATGTSFAYLGVLVAPLIHVQLDHAMGSKRAALAGLAVLAVVAGFALLGRPDRLRRVPST